MQIALDIQLYNWLIELRIIKPIEDEMLLPSEKIELDE